MLLLGSHVSFGKEQLLGSVKEALSYGANTFMFYTGAPQITLRKELHKNLNNEALMLMKQNGIDIGNVICHAPYIINLANNKDMSKYEFSIEFLKKEIARCHELGIKTIVLHPGSAVGIDRNIALKNIIYALNVVLEHDENVVIVLETMAGKGSELGINMGEINTIIEGIDKQDLIGVCLDTCHLNDSGIDIEKWDEYIRDFDKLIGLNKVRAIHINDSKNIIASHKDRHENIGFGTIGFDTLLSVIYDDRFSEIPKILETPYIGNSDTDKNRIYPPYKFEIMMIKDKKFNPLMLEEIRKYYQK